LYEPHLLSHQQFLVRCSIGGFFAFFSSATAFHFFGWHIIDDILTFEPISTTGNCLYFQNNQKHLPACRKFFNPWSSLVSAFQDILRFFFVKRMGKYERDKILSLVFGIGSQNV
jgi:hypothetical protein